MLSPTRLLVLLGVVLIVPLGLIGGFDAVASSELPTAEPDTVIHVEPFDVTLTAARYGEELVPAVYADEGITYLFVAVVVTNTTALPVSSTILAEGFALTAGDLELIPWTGTRNPRVYRTEDALSAKVYSPDVEVPSVVVWRVDSSVTLPDQVTVTLNTHVWRESSLDGSPGWRDPTPSVTVDLDLKPLKDA